jgi:hypothetical protein
MERWFLYSRNSIAPAVRRLNPEVIVTDAHKQRTASSCSLYESSANRKLCETADRSIHS